MIESSGQLSPVCRGLALGLATLMVAPPSLWAQTAPWAPVPTQAPTALPQTSVPVPIQQVAPNVPPCPPVQGSSLSQGRGERVVATPQQRSRETAPQAGTSGPTGQLPGGTEGGAPAAPSAAPSGEGTISPLEEGLLGPTAEQHAGVFGGGERRTSGPLNIEEAFNRFFILQGVSGALRQFGYSFFETPFPGLAGSGDAAAGPDYVLGPDDILTLHVWNVPDPNLARAHLLTVERDGTMHVPQLGSIPIAGMTLEQATRLIEARLRRLVKRFDMHLSMARLRTMRIFVVGEVVRPGAYELGAQASTTHALYAACGAGKGGSLRRIQVIRNGKRAAELDLYSFLLRGDRTQDARLKPGDTVLVPPIGPVVAIGGPVKRPAIYELLGPSPLSRLIELAGGLTPIADRRRAQVFRVEPGRQRQVLEITGGIEGPRPGEPNLQDGDFVRINAISTALENTVSLHGAVRNPGAYPFRAGMRISDVLRADQLTQDAYLDRAEVVRTHPETYETKVTTFSPRALLGGDRRHDLLLQRLDKLVIVSQTRTPGIVTIKGEVRRAGRYARAEGERLSSVLKRAGGFTAWAYPDGIVMFRESVRRAQETEVSRYIALERQRLTAESSALIAGGADVGAKESSTQADIVALNARIAALTELASRSVTGRVVLRLPSLDKLEGSEEDVVLENGDVIDVPARPSTVTVLGAVRNPNSFTLREGLSPKDYVELAGGVTRDAELGRAYVVRASGATDLSLRTDSRGGDVIIVPQDVEPKTRTLPLLVAVSGILASLATVALAFVVIEKSN